MTFEEWYKHIFGDKEVPTWFHYTVCKAAYEYGKTKREWVGLTDEEGAEIWGDAHDIDWNRLITPKEIVKRIEAKLRERNT